MKAEVLLITPNFAKDLLSNMPANRTIRKSKVDQYARDMANGEWKISHQGIALDSEGRLIDGQHRLTALLKANVAIEMWVFLGVPNDAKITFDSNIPRSASDAIFFSTGEKINQSSIAIAKLVDTGIFSDPKQRNYSNDEINEICRKHINAISFSRQLFNTSMKGISSAPIAAVVARAYYTQDRSRLEQFARILYTGVVEDGQSDLAAIRLRDYVKAKAGRLGGGSARKDLYLRTENALSKFLKRQPIQALYQASKELFPLPEETHTQKESSENSKNHSFIKSSDADYVRDIV